MNQQLHQLFAVSDLRLRLAGLRLQDSHSNSHWAPFSEAEIRNEPIKWLKYLLLDRLGVESIDRASAQIQRFSANDLDKARNWTLTRVQKASDSMNTMVVLKLVAWDKGAQLTNHRMFKEQDVEHTFGKLKESDLTGFAQIWCCESNVSGDGLNLGGRLTFPIVGEEQLLELVWFGSPRLLESVQPSFGHPYLRATKLYDATGYKVVETQLPMKYEGSLSLQMMRSDMEHVAERLAWRLPAMLRLISVLRAEGAREVCFCFKVTDGILTVIDWDSELESVPT